MAIKELTQEQIRTWTLKQKDEWWLKNVYKGDMPQLTLRSAITGMFLGGLLSLTNLYVGIKTGWTLGVGITSVIVSFAAFKIIEKLKLGSEMTLLENNAMQSVATSAGYMTAPLVSAIPAYMLVANHVIPAWQTMIWLMALALLGVLFAFPLKKRFINDDQLPFPEGYAAGVVLDNLHTDQGKKGIFKAKLLMTGAIISSGIELIRNHTVMERLRLGFLAIPEYWDEAIYKLGMVPSILGTPLKDLTIRIDTSVVLFFSGGLLNLKTGVSLLTGAVVNYWILAPYFIKQGVIQGSGFKNITMWALWGGVAMMTSASLYSFFSKPEAIISAFRGLGKKRGKKEKDVLAHIELPMWISVVGVPVLGLLTVYLGHSFFGIHYLLGMIAIPLVFVFTLIAVNSTGLTAITPGGAIAKLTQLSFGVLAPGQITTNIATAGITTEVALNSSNLLMDIKPGYMLGGKPRHQAMGHVLGIFAGAIVAVPVFYTIFDGNLAMFTSEKLPMPSVTVWKAVSEILMSGLGFLHPTAKAAVVIGAVLGVVFEILNNRMKGKFPLSGVGVGLAFVLRFTDSFSMGMGAIIFSLLGKYIKDPKTFSYRALVENRETICAGAVAGGSIVGLILIILETAVF